MAMSFEKESHYKVNPTNKNIYVDIDETICFYESDVRIYKDAKPDYKHISKINTLYDQGNIITYWTARGSSKPNDILRFAYIEDLTRNQLINWGCKFHFLKIGKPGFDLLIDDKTKRIEELL